MAAEGTDTKKFFSSKEFIAAVKKRRLELEKIMRELGIGIADPKNPAGKNSK